jgi:hypothetical protein
MKKLKINICEYCKKEFFKSYLTENCKRIRRFCCHKCSSESMKGKNNFNYNEKLIRNKPCEICSNSLPIRNKKFCSSKCYGKYLSENKKGINNHFYKKHQTKESNEKNRIAHTGKNNSMYGRHHTKESNLSNSKSHTGIKRQPFSNEWTEKMSIAHAGEKNHNWLNGKSFEPYGLEFNRKLKNQVRIRDNFKCQECSINQTELIINEKKIKLDCHHIDYEKKSNTLNNLISLCRICHLKTNHNRDYWEKHFKEKINSINNPIKEIIEVKAQVI